MKARTCAVVTLPSGDLRLTVDPVKGTRPAVIDFHPTDAEAVGEVMKRVARSRATPRLLEIEALRADRDALAAAVAILEGNGGA